MDAKAEPLLSQPRRSGGAPAAWPCWVAVALTLAYTLTGALVVNWPRALVSTRRAVATRTDRAEVAARLTGDGARSVTPAV